DGSESSEDDESEPEAPVALMVTTRARRTNAGNRMSTLIAKSAEEEEEWGEEWEEAPNEEEFQGDDVNEQDDYNMDSSSEEGDDDADDDDAGEKELRRAERQEKTKKRKMATNPFAARVAAVARKKVKLDVPPTQSPESAPPRPKKKSERASWIPTEEDGPVRTSSRKQTMANKETTLAKLKAKDRRRDDTLAMMKAAEARKAKAKEKPLTQAERLAEAARNERINKKTLHRWEEAEEARAAERQAKIDAMKNREIDGPFVRYYSGPAIWVDDKIKYTGKDAPTMEYLEEKLNKEPSQTESQAAQPESGESQPQMPTAEQTQSPGAHLDEKQPAQSNMDDLQTSMSTPHMPSLPTSMAPPSQESSQLPWTPASQAVSGDVFMGSHGMSFPSSIMFAPPSQDSFLYGIDQYAQNQQSQSTTTDLPPNPFTQASPYQQQYVTSQTPYSQQHPSLGDPLLTQHGGAIGPQALLSQFQKSLAPPIPPAPPRRRVIRRALRNLLILSNFPNLDAPPISSRAKTAASLIKDKDKSALIQLSKALFNWSLPDATAFVTAMLASSAIKPTKKNLAAHDAALAPKKPLCAVTNAVARYRDPETGIAYRDARAFGVLRGVVGGGFVWSGALGCYVGGRAKPLESMSGGKGFLGMPPAKNVPRRFWEMGGERKVIP
ncbi:YL1 nuclear protein-domain-containing protein, partial [Pyrenochaeta sp. MPI-SDFR-AT-0127]